MMMELTGDEIVNTLVMTRQVDDRRVIVVEGQEDIQLLELHLEEAVSYLQPAGSKPAVLRAAELCASDVTIDWALFVIDADFDRGLGLSEGYPANVVASEKYDLLMDVINLDANLISRAIITHAPPNTERQIRQRFSASPHDVAQVLAKPVGALRYLVVTGEFEISVRNWSFRGLTQAHLADKLIFMVSVHAAERSGRTIEVYEIEDKIRALLIGPQSGDLHLTNGHDLVAAVADIVRFESGKSLGHDWICAAIRVALTCGQFQKLEVVRKIEDWAQVTGGSVFTCQPHAA